MKTLHGSGISTNTIDNNKNLKELEQPFSGLFQLTLKPDHTNIETILTSPKKILVETIIHTNTF